jgi:hypothetical protein
VELGARCGTWVGDASVMSGVDRVDFSSQNLKIDRSVKKSVTLKDIYRAFNMAKSHFKQKIGIQLSL